VAYERYSDAGSCSALESTLFSVTACGLLMRRYEESRSGGLKVRLPRKRCVVQKCMGCLTQQLTEEDMASHSMT
jgi:hypothetical protein